MSVTALLGSLISPVTELVSKFVPDKDQAAKLAFEIATLAERQAHEQIVAQLAVNEAEAKSGSVFVGGWRPGMGWVCVTAIATNTILLPLFGPVIESFWGISIAPLDTAEIMPIVLGMLGLGGMRSYEKRNGVARS